MWSFNNGLSCRFCSQSLRHLFPTPVRFASQSCSSTEKRDSNYIDQLLHTWNLSTLSPQDHTNSKLETFQSSKDVWPSPWFGRSNLPMVDPFVSLDDKQKKVMTAPSDQLETFESSKDVWPSPWFGRSNLPMVDPLVSLDDMQKEAVTAPSDQPLYIEASSGTGKTTVIQRRLLHLVFEKKVDPSRILSVGFSSRGAENIRAGVKEHAPYLLSSLSITTLQSLSYAIILRHHLQAGFANPPTVLDGNELAVFICKAWFACNPREATLILQEEFPSLISSLPEGPVDWDSTELDKLWNSVLQAEGHSDLSHSGREQFFYDKCSKCSKYRQEAIKFQRFIMESKKKGLDTTSPDMDDSCRKQWLKYLELLRVNGVIASDDMIMLALELLRKFPEIAKRLRERFSHLLLDGFEDISQHQLDLCLLFRTPFITVAIDERQGIYQCRDALPNVLTTFKKEMENRGLGKHTKARLEINHRSCPQIIALANALLDGRSVSSDQQSLVMARRYRNSEDQAKAIAARLLMLHSGKTWSNCAILLSHVYGVDGDTFEPIQKALAQHRIPYVLQIGNSVSIRKPDVEESSEQHCFMEDVEFKDLLAYLKLCVNVDDDDAFRRAVERPTRTGRLRQILCTIDNLYQKDAAVSSLHEAAKKFIMSSKTGTKVMKDFVECIVPALQVAATRSVEETLNLIEKFVKYRAFRRREKKAKKAENRRDRKKYRSREVQPQDVLLDMAIVFDKNFTGKHPVQEFLDRLSIGQGKELKLKGAVTLSTVHQAKGQEWNNVFVASFDSSRLFPAGRCGNKFIKKEHCRISHVACTRARKHLFLVTNRIV